jgi:HPt (histidine-containing phosphotransfer) domain-containing protein
MDDLPEGLSASHQAAFLQLRRRFCAGLPERWAQIEGAADTPERVAALHRLAGAAGSYGLVKLDTCARQALRLVESSADAALVCAALADLRATLEQAADTI